MLYNSWVHVILRLLTSNDYKYIHFRQAGSHLGTYPYHNYKLSSELDRPHFAHLTKNPSQFVLAPIRDVQFNQLNFVDFVKSDITVSRGIGLFIANWNR